MKRKLINFVLVAATCLSIFGGVASFLAPASNSTETAPTLIAQEPTTVKPSPVSPGTGSGSGGAHTNGNSWGG